MGLHVFYRGWYLSVLSMRAQMHRKPLAQREQHINKQQSRRMLAGKIPRVRICLFVCVPKLLVPVSLKAKFSCIQPLQKWLVTTVSALDPERAKNCMSYSLLYIHRKCCYLY